MFSGQVILKLLQSQDLLKSHQTPKLNLSYILIFWFIVAFSRIYLFFLIPLIGDRFNNDASYYIIIIALWLHIIE